MKASVGVVDPVCLCFSCGVTRRANVRTVFTWDKKTYPGILFPDRANASRRRLACRGREQPSVGTSATGHGLHLSVRTTGLTGTEIGESLEDGAEGGEGGRHRERSMHASLDQAKYFWGQRGAMGRAQDDV